MHTRKRARRFARAEAWLRVLIPLVGLATAFVQLAVAFK